MFDRKYMMTALAIAACGCGAGAEEASPAADQVTQQVTSAASIIDTHRVVTHVSRQADFWHFPPSNDNGLYNYLFTLTASPAQLKAQIPGFNASTAKPFVFAPSRKEQPWSTHALFAFGNNDGSLASSGQFYTADLDLGTLTAEGVAFGVDVPNTSGGLNRYWFQAPKQNASLQIEN
jgi:hypothetical protein